MVLPQFIQKLLFRLEEGGFAAYAVGGCVRDSLLGLTPNDYDLCTAATPEAIKGLFSDCPMFLSGEKHGTVSIVTEGGVVEITTFRRETGYSDNRHPDRVEFVPKVEADLARRDFTVNAMAYSPIRGFADPFGGRADLENRVLRAVGDPTARFREDALRILRGVRFAVRFRLTPEPSTLSAMTQLAPLMDSLARERVFSELCGLLPKVTARDLQTFAPVITQALPELGPCVDFDQHSPHHLFDVYTHIAHVTEATPPQLPLRFAALLHDVGKPPTFTRDENGRGHFYGHAQMGAALADQALRRLKAPTVLREQVVFLIESHMTPLAPDRKLLRRRLRQFGPEAVTQLLALQQADFCSKGVAGSGEGRVFAETSALLSTLLQEDTCLTLKDLAVNGRDLMALGIPPGPELGKRLEQLLNLVVDETIPNTREALLAALQKGEPS